MSFTVYNNFMLTLLINVRIADYKDSDHSGDRMKSMTHSSVMSDGVTDDGIVHNGCQHTQSEPSSSIWQITLEEAEYILKPDGTFLVREISGESVTDPSSSSIYTHSISVV